MSLLDPTAHSEAMLGYHDPTLGVGIDAPRGSGAAAGAEGDGFLATLLDVINPLQHIPLLSTLYREITGDEISPTARLIGGGLFGGPIGFASASANVILEQASGDDILGHTLAAFSDDVGQGPASRQAAAQTVDTNIHEQADAGGATDPVTQTGIVMGGPPALASLTPKAAGAAPVSLAPPVAPRVNAKPNALIDQAINNATPSATPAAVAAPAANAAELNAFLRSLPANWVNEALRDAETMNQALQNGAAPETGTAKPWVGNAMLDALNKYEALTRARTGNGPS